MRNYCDLQRARIGTEKNCTESIFDYDTITMTVPFRSHQNRKQNEKLFRMAIAKHRRRTLNVECSKQRRDF